MFSLVSSIIIDLVIIGMENYILILMFYLRSSKKKLEG